MNGIYRGLEMQKGIEKKKTQFAASAAASDIGAQGNVLYPSTVSFSSLERIKVNQSKSALFFIYLFSLQPIKFL